MDPSNTQPPEGDSNLSKLEKDLEALTKEASTNVPPSSPSVQPQEQTPPLNTAPSVAPPTPTPVQTVVPPTVLPESPPIEQPGVKKSSPLLVVALVLMVVALVAAIAYVVGMKFFSSTPSPTPVASTPALIIPTPSLEASPSSTPVLGSPTPSATASGSPKATPTVQPSSTATPVSDITL